MLLMEIVSAMSAIPVAFVAVYLAVSEWMPPQCPTVTQTKPR